MLLPLIFAPAKKRLHIDYVSHSMLITAILNYLSDASYLLLLRSAENLNADALVLNPLPVVIDLCPISPQLSRGVAPSKSALIKIPLLASSSSSVLQTVLCSPIFYMLRLLLSL